MRLSGNRSCQSNEHGVTFDTPSSPGQTWLPAASGTENPMRPQHECNVPCVSFWNFRKYFHFNLKQRASAAFHARRVAACVCVCVAHILLRLYYMYYYVLLFMNQLQLMSVCARNDFLVIQASQTRRAAERQLGKQTDGCRDEEGEGSSERQTDRQTDEVADGKTDRTYIR